MAYTLLKNKINRGQYNDDQVAMQEMLDVFAIGERITTAQYQELTALLNARHPQDVTE